MKEFLFTPDSILPLENSPEPLSVKGQQPALAYGFSFLQIYPTIPSLDLFEAYRQMKALFWKTDRLLFNRLSVSRKIPLPLASTREEAYSALNFLFSIHPPNFAAPFRVPGKISSGGFDLFSIEGKKPFSFEMATTDKLLHSLHWIDSNIKLQIEKIGINLNLPDMDVKLLVETAFSIYSYLIKATDFYLARNMNFNYSMFFQERIISILFDQLSIPQETLLLKEGKLVNDVALNLLQQYVSFSFDKLTTLSVFMGVAWVDLNAVQKTSHIDLEHSMQTMDHFLDFHSRKWCIDHRNHFLEDIKEADTIKKTILCILDDNGESVFDLALFQHLLIDYPKLEVVFTVNSFPVSHNIALSSFKYLLDTEYFRNLNRFFDQGRARLITERQVFRSFETSSLMPSTVQALKKADLIYIKGANFFETFQLKNFLTYYAFTAHGYTSLMLTGCPKGSGIFARIPYGHEGFYYSAHQITNCREVVNSLNQKQR
ncbi:MAG: DUF89 family protein [Lewinellaceae bacterium]|nr:DUF89 family protein [Lewinellaceae bacterium]